MHDLEKMPQIKYTELAVDWMFGFLLIDTSARKM